MKIAVFAITLDLLSGGERRKIELARRLEQRGYDVTLYVKNTKINQGWQGLKLPSKIEEYSERPIKADFIFMANFDLPFAQAQKSKGQKVWMISYFWPQTYQFLQDSTIIKIAHSSWHANWLERKFNQEAVRALGGINTDFFTPLKGGPTANIKSRENLIIAQKGRSRDKNYKFVELALKRLGRDDYRLELASGKDQYELREKYRKAAFFVSAEIYPIFCWNNPAAEAMACGCPVIVVDHPAIKDHCLHRKTAEVVNLRVPCITEELRRAMQLLIDNEDYRRSLAENAYRYIHNFSYDKVIDTIEAEVLTNHKRPKTEKAIRLNLGCGPKEKHLPGYVNIDKDPRNEPDLSLDLEKAHFPYEESSVDKVYASHLLEHIKNFIPLMEEIYRVCKPGAEVEIFIPYGLTDSGIGDPFHQVLLCERTFDYFDKSSLLFLYDFKCNLKVIKTERNSLNHIHIILKAIKDGDIKKEINKITYFPLGSMTTASSRLRCYLIAERLRKKGYKTSFESLEPTDVAIFQKRISAKDLEIALELKKKGARIILDMCDAMWTAGQEKPLLDFIPVVDCVTTSSSKIADYFKDKVARIETIYDPNWERIPQVEKEKKPTICWVGSIYSVEAEHCLDILTEPLNRLHQKIDFDFRIITDGEVKLEKLDFEPRVIEFRLEDYLTQVAKSHVGVIPYPDTEWCASKSNNKVCLFMSLGVPVVCSSIPAYEEIIIDGENGYLVKNNDPEKWYQAIKGLLLDKNLLASLQEQGQNKAKKFSLKNISSKWERLLKTL